MAYAKKTAKNEAYQKLKTDLKEGNPLGNAYLFYGEESYLREYYLGEIRKRLIPAGFEEFNYHALEGKDLTAQSLTEMAEAMPMMAERTLIVVTDWDIYKLNEDQRERFIALLEDLPEYCCIVFVYDTVAYKQNKTMKKLCKAMDGHVTPIEFKVQDTSDLTAWIARRFRALGKQIDRQTAEYLIFLCGGLMTGLSQEIAKIGAYAKGEVITQRDIDAVADPVLSAEIFKMTDAVSQSDYNKAAAILGDRQARTLETKSGKRFDVDGIFVLRASVAPDKLVPGLATDGPHVAVDAQMRTNLPGCFACGDLAGKPYQYIKAAGQGNIAALSAVEWLAEQK